MHKLLLSYVYKLKLQQHMKPADCDCRKILCEEMLQKTEKDGIFLNIMFFWWGNIPFERYHEQT